MKPIQLTCAIYKMEQRKDGGFRIVLDLGSESLKGYQDLTALRCIEEQLYEVVVIPRRALVSQESDYGLSEEAQHEGHPDTDPASL